MDMTCANLKMNVCGGMSVCIEHNFQICIRKMILEARIAVCFHDSRFRCLQEEFYNKQQKQIMSNVCMSNKLVVVQKKQGGGRGLACSPS